jgi:hypothetical protein
MHKCLFYHGNINCSYFLPLVEISVDDLNGGDKNCDIFLTSLIFSLTVWMTLVAISLDKSSKLKEGANGNTIDMVIYDRVKLFTMAFYSLFSTRAKCNMCARILSA